jgi:hypothetical protein
MLKTFCMSMLLAGDLTEGQLQVSNEKTTAPLDPKGVSQPNRLILQEITEQSFEAHWQGSHDAGKNWNTFLMLTYRRSTN